MTELTSKNTISKKSKKVLDFIIRYQQENAKPPTVREIAKNCGFTSPSTAHFYIKKLEEAGLINRTGRNSRSLTVSAFSLQSSVPVPLVGTIRAGFPVTAEENIESYFSVPVEFAKSGCFFLRVKGNSMERAGILPGDLVLIKPSKTIENGEIGAFLVKGEATIKRFKTNNSTVVLMPENPEFEQIYPEELHILGKVTLLIRKYR